MPSDPHYWSAKHRAWRKSVLRRDKYLCQECLRYGRKTPAEQAHHKKPRRDYPDLQYDVSNGVALCTKCHDKIEPRNERRKSNPPTSQKHFEG